MTDQHQGLALDVANTLLDAVMAGEPFAEDSDEDRTPAINLALGRLRNGAVTVTLNPEAEQVLEEHGAPFNYEIDLTSMAKGALITIDLLARTLAGLGEFELADVVALVRHDLAAKHADPE